MTIGISKVRGISADVAKSLKAKGVTNSAKLLERSVGPKDRAALAAELGVDAKQVLELANRADLARVKGIGKVFSDLLENAGVDTVKELSKRKPENLCQTMAEFNAKNNTAKRNATLAEVTDWINQAKALPATLKY
ncbi:MAG: DUF4332 domain-containing protein [Thermoflexales bacterium]|nr:DUF4332 domain-containing protein [Thermoflexales bacterium]